MQKAYDRVDNGETWFQPRMGGFDHAADEYYIFLGVVQ
jgi:hypothetical protein